MPGATTALVQAVVSGIDASLRADGSRVHLKAIDDDTAILQYVKGESPDCETCVLSEEDLQTFVLDALQQRNVGIAHVTIETA
jgi:Fe-S cluster biogenesis protein NfuA